MGLDITAYRKLKPAPHAELDSDGYPKDYDAFHHFSQVVIDWTEKNWPGHTSGLKAGVYSAAETDGFRAGSYGGYNYWRSQLAQMAHGVPAEVVWDKITQGPFVELIHFADNKGVIGPTVAAKIAKDFADHEEKAKTFAASLNGEADYFLSKYTKWRKAFEMAADGGAVDFH